jgi:hypothetical protein
MLCNVVSKKFTSCLFGMLKKIWTYITNIPAFCFKIFLKNTWILNFKVS